MKRIYIALLVFLSVIQHAFAVGESMFTPVCETNLRVPAVPLLLSDPYFSVWSAYDELNDGPTTHWSGSEKPLSGLLRVDGTVYRFMGAGGGVASEVAVQTSVDVLPTQTYYTFQCGKVKLELVFTAPLLMDNLDMLSTPINYISYRVSATDKKQHDVQIYFDMNSLMASESIHQPVVSRIAKRDGLVYLNTGTVDQPYLDRKGDFVRIDWGYAYLVSLMSHEYALGNGADMRKSFQEYGSLPRTSVAEIVSRDTLNATVMANVEGLGLIDHNGRTGFVMVGYDDIYSIEYMYRPYMAYWKHNGSVTIEDAFLHAMENYEVTMQRCRDFDKMIYADAERAGGRNYAEILSATYRQVIAAHKLFTDNEGRLMFFSKENASNGCINTVDLTYPSAPLFLVYNTELMKGMMTSIFEYSASGRWNKPFPAHDLGKYPIANGQAYNGDMPLEEAGNMLILSAAIAKIEGNASYAARYWNLLTIWTDYLVDYGQDPGNQLCTDDFAGHWAHNTNLSAKAIMGIAAYSEMARMLGLDKIAGDYMDKARKMAEKWEKMANDGDHYRLAFDRPDTWSQKYNIIWDKLWGLNLFHDDVADKEVAYYLSKQNKYGLPLDCRKTYTKSDWIMWVACLADDMDTFSKFVNPVYDFINETSTRWPVGDWHETTDGTTINFRARSVVGGYWMKVLFDKCMEKSN